MSNELPGISQIKELLNTARFAAMATVNADGSPHNSPLVFLHDNQFTRVYWGSHPDSLHSKNILRTGQLFIVVYDAFNARPGLYIQGEGGHLLSGEELKTALEMHNEFRERIGKLAIPLSYYTGGSPQKMWSATITKLWINAAERDSKGFLIKDYKIEIKREDLVG